MIADKDGLLERDNDYTVTYSYNSNVGQARIIIEGKGDYVGKLTTTFDITEADFADVCINSIAPQPYTGDAIEPKISVSFNGKTVSQYYYDVEYSNNIDVGIATVTLTGKTNFIGTASTTFTIIMPGWYEDENGDWYYYNTDATMAKNKWVRANDGIHWCYVDDDGKMVKNAWRKDSKGWCWLDDDGYMVTSQWVQDSKGYCWVGSNGYMDTSTKWIKLDGDWYHITKGYRDQSKWMKDSKGWCWLQEDGKMLTNGWAQDSKGYCWVDSSGYMSTATKWIKIDGDWYHITKGYRDQSKWMKDSKGWCWLQADGKMLTNGFAKDSKGMCYIAADGYMPVATKWVKVDGIWYHITKGYLDTSKWFKDSKGWCYVGADGKMVTDGFAPDSHGNCWIGPEGYMLEETRLVEFEGDTYGIRDGYMVTNDSLEIDGVTYTFGSDGKLIS